MNNPKSDFLNQLGQEGLWRGDSLFPEGRERGMSHSLSGYGCLPASRLSSLAERQRPRGLSREKSMDAIMSPTTHEVTETVDNMNKEKSRELSQG